MAQRLRSDLPTGERIRLLRKDRDLNQQQLAGLIGKSPSWMYLVESGRLTRLDMETIQQLARVLKVRAVDITGPLYDPLAARGLTARGEGDVPVVLAILPFRFTAGGDLDEFLVSGFCDDIVARLSKLHALRIIGADSTRHAWYENDRRPVCEVGKTLGAAAVLTGSLREYSGILHINVHLVDVATSVTVWSEAFDFRYDELADARAIISASVAEALRLRLSLHEATSLRDRSTHAVSAYEFYLRGAGLLATNREEDLGVALSMLTRATELDESFADAHAYRGYALWRKYFCGWDADVCTLRSALDSAARALALDPRSTSARMTRVRVYWDMGWHEEALVEGFTCHQRNPTNLDALLALARAYNNAGMADLCLPLVEQVLRADPSNPSATKLRIWNHLMLADYTAAGRVGEQYLEGHPEDTNTPWAMCMAQFHLGNFTAAASIAERVIQDDRSNFTMWLLLGYVYRGAGDDERARRVWASSLAPVRARLASFGRNYRAQAWLANLEAGAGLREEATETIRMVQRAEPDNAYLLYRLAQASAELGSNVRTLELLDASVGAGFLSVQMMRCEEICGTRSLVVDPRYQAIAASLEEKVRALKVRYATSLVMPA